MTTQTLTVNQFDRERLERKIQQILTDAHGKPGDRESAYAKRLAEELDRAQTVPPGSVPPDVVTMNSIVQLEDLDSGREVTYALSFPADSDPMEGRISILAPVGLALLGTRVGDEVTWQIPKGQCRYRVKAIIYQPEAAGHFHL